MSEMIQQLHTDHVNMARLLDLVEEQMKVLQAGEVPDYVLMMDIMQYMTNYPDLFHHPREDVLFRLTIRRREEVRSMVSDLIREHDTLTRLGKVFFDLLHTVIHEHPVERGTLEKKAREYISVLRTHMNVEEGSLFPVSKDVLREEDWEEIERIMGNREDPLFGKNAVEAEYLALYDYIRGHES